MANLGEWLREHGSRLTEEDRDMLVGTVLPLLGIVVVLAAGGLVYEAFVAPQVEAAQIAKATQEAAGRIIFECTQHGQTVLRMLTLEGQTPAIADDIRVVAQQGNIDSLSPVSAVLRETIFQQDHGMPGFVQRLITLGHGEIFSGIKNICDAVQTSGPAVLPPVAP